MNLSTAFCAHIERTSLYLLASMERHAPGLPPASEQEIMLQTVQQGLDLPAAWPHVRQVLHALAPRVEQTALYPSWTALLERGLAAGKRRHDGETTAQLSYCVGQIAYHRTEYARANELLVEASIGFAELGRPADQARCYNRLAYVARLQRRQDQARAWVEQALPLLADDDPERRYALFVLGVLAYDAHEWARSVDYLGQALDVAQQHGDPRTLAIAYGDMGPPLRELKRYDEAIAAYTQAIDRLNDLQDWDRQARYRMNLGNVYLSTDRFQEALDCYRQAETVFRRNNARGNFCRIAMNSGQAYRGLGQWQASLDALRTAALGFREIGNIDSASDALDELGLTYQAMGEADAARQAFDEALHMLDEHPDDVGYAARRQIIEAHCAALPHPDLALSGARSVPLHSVERDA